MREEARAKSQALSPLQPEPGWPSWRSISGATCLRRLGGLNWGGKTSGLEVRIVFVSYLPTSPHDIPPSAGPVSKAGESQPLGP